MKHTIPRGNWATALADAIEAAQDNDTIVVHNTAMQKLAERCCQEIHPYKNVIFEIESDEQA